MPDPEPRRPGHVMQTPTAGAGSAREPRETTPSSKPRPDAVLCERCNVEMFRMHAVWRCPNCGFKTDCCGW